MKQIKKCLKAMVLVFYHIMAHILPVNKRIIVFQSSLGRNYSGSPRAVYEKMAELGLDRQFHCYYILNHPETYQGKLPGRIKLLKNSRIKYYCIMAAAGIWVSDTRFQNYMIKRKQTIYIQTWHGTPLKKLALDLDALYMAGEQNLAEYKEAFRKNAAAWDYLISQNPFSTETFRRAFAFQGKILPIGYPRNDVLFKKMPPDKIAENKKKHGFPPDKKIMLYAPTWRDNAYYDSASYRFETQMDFEKMRQAFKGEYILAAKFHYMVQEKADWNKYPDFVYPVSAETDIADLYPLADLLITDYSSVMFDYSILKRPMFFYAYDLPAYRDTLRGFYFDFTLEAPGPIVTTTDELIQEIKDLTEENYKEKYGNCYLEFCRKYNPYDNGTASERVVEIIAGFKQHFLTGNEKQR